MKATDQEEGSTRKAKEREARRCFILEAARGLLAERTPEQISMDEIASAAEYTRRTLYSYFASRDDIWLWIHLENTRKRWALQERALQTMETAPDRLEAFAMTLYAHWKENPDAMKVDQYWNYYGIEEELVEPAIFEEFEEFNNLLATELSTIFQEGIDAGSLRPDLPIGPSVSQFLYALRAVLWRALSSSYSFLDSNPDQYVRHYLDQYRSGICTTPRANQ